MKKTTDWESQVLKRLNLLISLFLEQADLKSGKTVAGKIHKLSDMGVSPPEIAQLVGKPLKYIWTNLGRKKVGKRSKTVGR
jgi:hypothetical protein